MQKKLAFYELFRPLPRCVETYTTHVIYNLRIGYLFLPLQQNLCDKRWVIDHVMRGSGQLQCKYIERHLKANLGQ